MHVPPSPVFKPHDRHSHSAITHVIDQLNTAGRAVCARDILSPLDAEGLALLRRSDHRRRQTGKPRFLCGFCQEPVHVRVTSVAASGCVDGRRATFAHDPRPDPRDCPFRSLAKQSSAGEIDAARFNGRQEGARHKHLKARLCRMLAADPRIASADCEVLVTGISADGQAAWRRPDVLAVARDGRRLAFDVQVASPLLATIDGRERFYSAQGVAWHWIVDADQPDRLHLQGFQDLIMPQACRVLGFNDRIANLSKEDRHSRFHLLHVRETHDRRHLKVRFHTIGLETALRLAGFPVGQHRCHAVDLRALGFFNAILNKDLSRAGRIFDLLSGAGDTPNWAQARRDHLPGAISTLLSLTSRRTPEAVATTLRYVLPADIAQHGQSPALLIALSLAVDATRQHRLGHWDGQARAVLDATLRDVAANPAFAQRFRARWSPLLHRLFPSL